MSKTIATTLDLLKNKVKNLGTPEDSLDATNKEYVDEAVEGRALASHTHTSSQVTGLATVATSGSYNDLSNKPTIPTVNNAQVTIKQGGVTKGFFTLNQSVATTVNLDSGASGEYNCTQILVTEDNTTVGVNFDERGYQVVVIKQGITTVGLKVTSSVFADSRILIDNSQNTSAVSVIYLKPSINGALADSVVSPGNGCTVPAELCTEINFKAVSTDAGTLAVITTEPQLSKVTLDETLNTNMVTLTFVIDPNEAGTITADGVDVTGSSIQVARGTVVSLHVDIASGYTLQNWNSGEWFDPDWEYEATDDATITCLIG